MREHTSGPWCVSDGQLLRVQAGAVCVCGVHRIGTLGGKGKGDALANARLIAAAPDLLAALRDCVNAMHNDNPADGWKEIIDAGRAAIARATGDAQS